MIEIIETHGKNFDDAATYEVNIKMDGQRVTGFSAYPLYEFPEDASLERDMDFAYDAVEFFRLGYEAGKRGEDVIYTENNENDDE